MRRRRNRFPRRKSQPQPADSCAVCTARSVTAAASAVTTVGGVVARAGVAAPGSGTRRVGVVRGLVVVRPAGAARGVVRRVAGVVAAGLVTRRLGVVLRLPCVLHSACSRGLAAVHQLRELRGGERDRIGGLRRLRLAAGRLAALLREVLHAGHRDRRQSEHDHRRGDDGLESSHGPSLSSMCPFTC